MRKPYELCVPYWPFPINCSPKGNPPSDRTGSEMAGTPNTEAGILKSASPVLSRPNGAAPVAAKVITASNSLSEFGVGLADCVAPL